MKVCFFLQSLGTGGAERTAAYLANYGVNHGYEVDVVIYGIQEYDLDEKVKVFNIGELNEKNNIFNRIKKIKARRKKFVEYCKSEKPDIIFNMLFRPIIYTIGIKNRPCVITSERSNPRWLKSKAKKLMRKYLLSNVDAMILQTNKAKEFYKNIKCDKVVIPNAIGNPEVYNTTAEIGKENKICAVGRLCEEKDYPTLFKAMQIVLEKKPDLKLEIYGKGALDESLKSLVNEMGLSESIIFMGNHKDVMKKISTSHCFVMTSISEGMPNALMEAMAIGLPSISTDYGNGVEDVITDGENGLVVKAGDYQGVADAILKFIDDKTFAKKCGKAASKFKETNHVDYISQKYYDYFEKVVNEHKSK
ncbi:MAG: glycosyltransferase family 4 protein [Clostridiales bacterium]|nr:glycosyltransferase family 4 protein [Clostridiales bacterium]